MTTFDLQEAVAKAKAAYEAMTPAQQARHDMEQRRSFVRGMCPSNMEFSKWCEVVDRTMPYSGYDFLAGELEKRDAEIERLRAGLDGVRIKLRDARDNLHSDHMFGLAGLCEALMVGVEAVIANQQSPSTETK